MKILATFALFFIGAAFGQDASCKNDFTTAVQCMRTEFENAGGVQELKSEYRAEVTACFQKAGCVAPDYNADPFADADFLKTIVEKFENLTPDQKECIRNKMKARIQQKIEQCLQEPIPQWAEDAWEHMRAEHPLTDAQKAELKGAIRAKVNILKAARQCENKETLGKCLIDARAKFGKEACERRQDCSKGASDSCKRQANQFREKVCACMDKAKEEMKQRMQSADSNPMAALSNLREQAGGWQADLNQCGIDTNAMMNDLRPKLQEYMLKKCNEAGIRNLGTGPIAMMRCAQQLRQSKGGDMKNLFGTLQDYMEQHGGGKDAFCDCDF